LGVKLSVMSLVIAKVPVPDFVGSAWLVAVTCTAAGEGRSAGAVYTPAEVIVPSVAFPPGTPFTPQLTAVSVVLITVAVKVAWPPSTTDPLVGFTVTSIVGGGGGGGDAPPAPQPKIHAPSERSAMTTIVVVLDLFSLLGERDRMPSAKQAKGQRKKRKQGTRICQTVSENSGEKLHGISRLPPSEHRVHLADLVRRWFSVFHVGQTSF